MPTVDRFLLKQTGQIELWLSPKLAWSGLALEQLVAKVTSSAVNRTF